MLLYYNRQALWKRTRAFGDVRIQAPLITGVVVESALKLAFAPPQGTLPKVLERQSPSDHKCVLIDKVVANGQRPHTASLHVPAADAELAISIARQVVGTLKDNLDVRVIAVDHYNAKVPTPTPGWLYVHDIVGRASNTTLLDSIEIKVRMVEKRKPKTFNWQKTLESEAELLWNAEIQMDPSPWRRRVLILVELSPSTGLVRGIHVSALEKNRRTWQTISGWEGFWSRTDGDEPDPDPDPSLGVALPAQNVAVARCPSATAVRQLRARLLEQGVDENDDEAWIKVADFLRAVGDAKKANQCNRFIENKKGQRWTRKDGGKPRINQEIKFKKGERGGGQGRGLLHGRLEWLRFVYWKHYHRN